MGVGWSQEEETANQSVQEPMGVGWSPEEQTANQPLQEPKKLPHNYHAIMQEANSPLDSSSGDLYQLLHAGVFLSQRKKYWVEKNSGLNCFMLFARDLSITWSEDRRYWCWRSLKETSNADIEVADLLDVCWLEVHGKFETSNLSPGATYEVVFVVMMKGLSYGWNAPVTLRLICPDGTVQQHKERLQEKPKEQWIELLVGDFVNPEGKGGEIQFSLFEYEAGNWKRGLIMKGAIVRPKN